MGAGQFRTNPGMLILIKSDATEKFILSITEQFSATTSGTLLSGSVEKSLQKSHKKLTKTGAEILWHRIQCRQHSASYHRIPVPAQS